MENKRVNILVCFVCLSPVRVAGCREMGGVTIRCFSSCVTFYFLLVRSQESGDFAAYETYEGARKHLVGLPSGVLEVVVWVSQHIKKSLNQFFILEGKDRQV